ncbi:copper chaperone PCu(A)C [Dyella telluris]|uniref:Copper chaperone PCu(A)C n=1 Tax=Dyella telluris TaxID=2763498 RepID=A0A7G8Q5M4_9GAMM|nr:copper chaperone PCu(A)C [Dyella telluris]QNK02082.1 copper chaperone PCu(A)C [Dyella telluris]
MSLRTALALPLLAAGLMFGTTAQASEADHIRASQAWIRVLPGDLPAGAYVTLENTGDQPASLRGAHTASYAGAMLHQSSGEGGVSRMSMVDALAIPAHGKAELSPGAYHLMLMNAKTPVKVGDKIKVTLSFGDGSTLDADFIARPANATGASG